MDVSTGHQKQVEGDEFNLRELTIRSQGSQVGLALAPACLVAFGDFGVM